MAASLGLETVLALNLLVGTTLFLFSVALSFLTFGLVSSWGAYTGCWWVGVLEPSSLQLPRSFHFLDYCWVGVGSHAPWGTFN